MTDAILVNNRINGFRICPQCKGNVRFAEDPAPPCPVCLGNGVLHGDKALPLGKAPSESLTVLVESCCKYAQAGLCVNAVQTLNGYVSLQQRRNELRKNLDEVEGVLSREFS